MSILQQGDSQGELCVADICKEGVAVRRGRTCCTRRREHCPVNFIATKDLDDCDRMLRKK